MTDGHNNRDFAQIARSLNAVDGHIETCMARLESEGLTVHTYRRELEAAQANRNAIFGDDLENGTSREIDDGEDEQIKAVFLEVDTIHRNLRNVVGYLDLLPDIERNQAWAEREVAPHSLEIAPGENPESTLLKGYIGFAADPTPRQEESRQAITDLRDALERRDIAEAHRLLTPARHFAGRWSLLNSLITREKLVPVTATA